MDTDKILPVNCPRAGDGVHNWLFKAALKLHRYYPNLIDVEYRLRSATQDCGRDVGEKEIKDAVRNSLPCARQFKSNLREKGFISPKRKFNRKLHQEIIGNGIGLAELRDLSPVKFDDSRSHTSEIIDQLFPDNVLLCCGATNSRFATRPKCEWLTFASSLQFIVPSPMSKVEGRTKEGHLSRHCLDNTGERRFLVIEFDKGEFDHHAAILWHLAQCVPMTLVVYSGGKSLHGWFYLFQQSENVINKIMDYAITLGADPATRTRSQFVRLPDGFRQDNGKRQSVIYFNPQTLG